MNKLIHNKRNRISYKINTFLKKKTNLIMKCLILKIIEKSNKNNIFLKKKINIKMKGLILKFIEKNNKNKDIYKNK